MYNYNFPIPAPQDIPLSKRDIKDNLALEPRTVKRLEEFVTKRPDVNIWPSLNDRIDEEVHRFLDDCEKAEAS